MPDAREEITVRAGLPDKWHCEVTLTRTAGEYQSEIEVHYDSVYHTHLWMSDLGSSKSLAMDKAIETVDRYIKNYLRDHDGRPPDRGG